MPVRAAGVAPSRAMCETAIRACAAEGDVGGALVMLRHMVRRRGAGAAGGGEVLLGY